MDINVANISRLIHFMDGLNDPRFTMSKWVHDCNTPACALGWACTLPDLVKAGLNFEHLKGGPTAVFDILGMSHQVFGSDVFTTLFGSNQIIETPQQWARHAREYLREHGHSVAPQTPAQAQDFQRFMDRTLKQLPQEVLA